MFQSQAVPPVVYIEQNVPFDELAALYTLADVMLVNSFSDGMNLVASEYVASQTSMHLSSNGDGVDGGGDSSAAEAKEESAEAALKKEEAVPGVLVLSEFAGAAEVIGGAGALLTNPYDTSAVAETLRQALHTLTAVSTVRDTERDTTWIDRSIHPRWPFLGCGC